MFTKVRAIVTSRAAHGLRGLAARVRAILDPKRTKVRTITGRYAGRAWSDTTERALNDDITGKRNQSFLP